MESVLILSYSDVARDPRVSKQIKALRDQFHVDLAAYGEAVEGIRSFLPIYSKPKFSVVRKARRASYKLKKDYDAWYWDAARLAFLEAVNGDEYAAIIANDIHTLPLALKLAGEQPKVILDAHEYHPEEFTDQADWKSFHQPYITYLCEQYIPKTAGFITVNEPIAELYKQLTNTPSTVVFNTAPQHDFQWKPTNRDAIRIIHHGVALRSRRIEDMITGMSNVDQRFQLDLMLMGELDPEYYEEVKRIAGRTDNVRIIDPVPLHEIVTKLHEYDIGLFLLPEANTNYRLALPNKLFEFIQARLAIVTTPNIEMKRFIDAKGIGRTTPDFNAVSLAEVLSGLDIETIDMFKQASHNNSERYSSEEAMKQYLAMVVQVAGKNA